MLSTNFKIELDSVKKHWNTKIHVLAMPCFSGGAKFIVTNNQTRQGSWKVRHLFIFLKLRLHVISLGEFGERKKCKTQHVLSNSLTGAEVDAFGKAAQWAVTCELSICPHAFLGGVEVLCDYLSSVSEVDLWSLTERYINATLRFLENKRKWYIKSQWPNCFEILCPML